MQDLLQHAVMSAADGVGVLKTTDEIDALFDDDDDGDNNIDTSRGTEDGLFNEADNQMSLEDDADDILHADIVDESNNNGSKKEPRNLEDILGNFNDGSNSKKTKTTSKVLIPHIEHLPQSSTSSKIATLKMPTFMHIVPHKYDVNTHNADVEREMFGDKVTSLIRFREKRDPVTNDVVVDPQTGKVLLESNARLVTFDDNTTQLFVGSHVFNVGFNAIDSTYAYNLIENEINLKNTNPKDLGLILECIGAVDSKMSVQPTSLHSETHAMLSKKLQSIQSANFREKNVQRSDIVKEDPFKKLERQAKEEEEKQRRERKLNNQQREIRSNSRLPGMNKGFMMDSGNPGDYDSINISSLKKGKQDASNRRAYDEDEIESDEEMGDDGEMDDFIVNEDGDDDSQESKDAWGEKKAPKKEKSSKDKDKGDDEADRAGSTKSILDQDFGDDDDDEDESSFDESEDDDDDDDDDE